MMNLTQATAAIRHCSEAMDAAYQGSVFDEWILVHLDAAGGRIIYYDGPRREACEQTLSHDISELRESLAEQPCGIGDFDFARHAQRTRFDAYLVAGKQLFLFCNNTSASMYVVAQAPLWRKAQVPFVELAEKFRAHPLVLPPASA